MIKVTLKYVMMRIWTKRLQTFLEKRALQMIMMIGARKALKSRLRRAEMKVRNIEIN